MKTLVLGLGNPILSDDGIGVCVARELENRIDGQDVKVEEIGAGGLALLHELAGYDRAIIIDAIQTRDGEVGQVYRLGPEAFDSTRHAGSPHDINFATALELGKRLGVPLPRQIVIFAVEVEDVTTFSERCTPKVEQTIPVVTDMVVQELGNDHSS